MSYRRFRNSDSEIFLDDISNIQISPLESLTHEQVNLVYNKFGKDVTTIVKNLAPMKILYKKWESLRKNTTCGINWFIRLRNKGQRAKQCPLLKWSY